MGQSIVILGYDNDSRIFGSFMLLLAPKAVFTYLLPKVYRLDSVACPIILPAILVFSQIPTRTLFYTACQTRAPSAPAEAIRVPSGDQDKANILSLCSL